MGGGVKWGSVLEQLLFVLYVSDIVEFIQSELEIFADDTKIYSVIETIHDIVKLQQDLWNMQDWSASWLLNLNFEKCKVICTLTIPHTLIISDSIGELNKFE